MLLESNEEFEMLGDNRAETVFSARNLGVTFGEGESKKVVIDGLNFEVSRGEFVCVVGPSGAGKTTFLRCVSGLMRPTTGEVTFQGLPVSQPPDGLAVVFQDYSRSLLPWMTAEQNVMLPLRNRLPRSERRETAAEALEAVNMQHAARSYPWQMSGGMQQRVAIARALAFRPRALLMDEPFASVDAQTRIDLEDLTLRVTKELGVTVLFVTHDIDEAVYLGDRVLVLSSSPAQVQEDLAIELPRPRDQITTKSLSEFADLRNHVLSLVRRKPADTPPR